MKKSPGKEAKELLQKIVNQEPAQPEAKEAEDAISTLGLKTAAENLGESSVLSGENSMLFLPNVAAVGKTMQNQRQHAKDDWGGGLKAGDMYPLQYPQCPSTVPSSDCYEKSCTVSRIPKLDKFEKPMGGVEIKIAKTTKC